MMIWLGLFLIISSLFFGIFWFFYKKTSSINKEVTQRIQDFSKELDLKKEAKVPFIARDDQLSKVAFFNGLLERLNLSKKLARLLSQAGSDIKVGRLLLIMLILSGVGYLLGLKMNNLIFKLACIPTLGSIPLIMVHMQRKKRLNAFIRAFPDAIDMMTSAIKAGHAFNQAMHLVGNEAPDPVGIEFKRAFEQYNLGLNIHDALLGLTDRIDSLDLKLFVTAILLQRETGGNLTEILVKISYTIRERFKLIGQIKTYTAQGRMSAWILGMLPVAFVLIISALNPGYLEPLFEDQLGHYVIILASIMQVIGFIFIRKIVRISYQ